MINEAKLSYWCVKKNTLLSVFLHVLNFKFYSTTKFYKTLYNSFRNNYLDFLFFCLKDNLKLLYLKGLKLHIMKKTLLILLLLVFSFSNGQTSIKALNGTLGADVGLSGDGQNTRENIIRYAPGSTFSQTASGPNQVWDISGLTALTSFWRYSNTAPTASELASYPGTTMVCSNFDASDNSIISKSYCSGTFTVADGIVGLGGLTGYSDAELTLNYSTNNVNLGSFPKVYGATTSDVVAGTYVFDIYSGTFTGTYTTTVDASGTMNSSFNETANVIRLKTVENLQISYTGLGVVGTFVQTTYRYYRATDYWPYLKSTNRVISIAALGLDTNVTEIEKAPATFELSNKDFAFDKSVSLFPNPATNSITVSSSQEIISLTIVDQLGKVVLTKNKTTNLDVSGLQSGIYFIKIVTDGGSGVKKFIKN